MKQYIEKISQEFIDEAKASPRMLEDLSAMERYMAESYGGRTFIELIQNADDAGAKRIDVFNNGRDLVVANDGRAFDKNDILAICRSGASQKHRGDSIGYRGVGFKSTTAISDEIIIYSANTYFTFSKALCAARLGLSSDKVPTVRIPFPYDGESLDGELIGKLRRKSGRGYTTFFIFKNAIMNKFETEINGFGADWLLFLKNVEEISIDIPALKKHAMVSRRKCGLNEWQIILCDTNESWRLVTDGSVTAAFKYENGSVVPCDTERGIFHCYLPTIDSTGFPFKINADFSTDPSRKHIIKDDVTMPLLRRAENLIVKIIVEAAANQREDMMPVVGLLYSYSSLNDFAIEFRQNIYRKLSTVAWVKTADNHLIKPGDVRLLPEWLTDDEKSELKKISSVAAVSVSEQMLWLIPNLEKILIAAGAKIYHNTDLLGILCVYSNCNQLNINTYAKIFSYCVKKKNYLQEELGDVYIPIGDFFQQLKNTPNTAEMNEDFKRAVVNLLTIEDIENLASCYPIFKSLNPAAHKKNQPKVKQLTPLGDRTRLAINKWKKPVQNCIASETLLGYSAKDVSRNEKAYSVISVSATGEKRYIAVKQIPIMGDSFTLSEHEYEAAQRLGNEYMIF